MMHMVADTFQVTLPEDLLGYVAVLQKIPLLVLRRGVMDVLAVHKYPRLPYPSEIVEACSPYNTELNYWHMTIDRALLLLGDRS